MAGDTTAWALRQMGIRSIVLEAQNLIGGRVLTSRKWKGVPCDMGAGWVSQVVGAFWSGVREAERVVCDLLMPQRGRRWGAD